MRTNKILKGIGIGTIIGGTFLAFKKINPEIKNKIKSNKLKLLKKEIILNMRNVGVLIDLDEYLKIIFKLKTNANKQNIEFGVKYEIINEYNLENIKYKTIRTRFYLNDCEILKEENFFTTTFKKYI